MNNILYFLMCLAFINNKNVLIGGNTVSCLLLCLIDNNSNKSSDLNCFCKTMKLCLHELWTYGYLVMNLPLVFTVHYSVESRHLQTKPNLHSRLRVCVCVSVVFYNLNSFLFLSATMYLCSQYILKLTFKSIFFYL